MRAWILAIVVVALGLRLYGLGDKNVWLDESASWSLVSMPTGALLERAAADVHPPLYYLALKVWVSAFGVSAVAMRSLSVLFGMLALLLAHQLTRGWLAPGPRACVLLWLAVTPSLIYFAQEARMYPAATAAALGCCLAYRRSLESGFSRPGPLAALVAAFAVALYVHYYTALVIAALWVHLLLTARAPAVWRRWIAAHAVIALLYLPWASTAIAQLTRGQSWREAVLVADLPAAVVLMLRQLLWGHHYPTTMPLRLAATAIAAVVAAGLAGLAVRLLTRRRADIDVFLACVCLVPAAGGAALLLVLGHMHVSRYVPFLLPLLAIAAARGLSVTVPSPRVVTALLALAAAASVPWTRAYLAAPSRDTDVRPIVRAIDELTRSRRGAALVLVEPGYLAYPMEYYSSGLNARYEHLMAGMLGDAIDRAATRSPEPGAWLVVENRSPSFATIASDPRVTPVDVPGSEPLRVRLFRIKTP